MCRPPDQSAFNDAICHVSHRLEMGQAVMIAIAASDAPGLYLRLGSPSMMPLACARVSNRTTDFLIAYPCDHWLSPIAIRSCV
jgi:hypothetical protein